MKILLVDDSKTIRVIIERFVVEWGHEVIHSDSGLQALEYIPHHPVDLVIMDVEMPGMDGFETTRRIRALPHIDWFPIIFLSAKIDDASYIRAIDSGGDAYLVKPINPVHLRMMIVSMERIYTVRVQLQKMQRELQLANQELQRLSLHDGLTGLANRRYFDQMLEKEYCRAKREHSPLSLIICDVDYFKRYNDSYGHAAGDRCLCQVAQAIRTTVQRPGDLPCRYGGEEFTVILPQTDLAGVQVLAEKIRDAVWWLNLPHQASEVAPRVTLSLGAATYTGQYATPDALLKAADDALYRAKAQGRNRYLIA